MEDPETHWMDSGEKIGMTMGEFVGLCIDGGQEDVCIVRVLNTTDDDEIGEFIMTLEVQLVPMKNFSEIAEKEGVTRVMDRLNAAIEKGLVT